MRQLISMSFAVDNRLWASLFDLPCNYLFTFEPNRGWRKGERPYVQPRLSSDRQALGDLDAVLRLEPDNAQGGPMNV